MSLARSALAAARGRRIPFVLTYHGLGHETVADDPHGLMTTPEAFAAQLDQLIALGYRLVGVEELWAAIRRGGRAADGLGAVTFDDGLAETLHTAAALLAERDAVGTAFVCPGLFGTDHFDLPPGRKLITGEQLVALAGDTLEVGAHSHTHADLPTLPRAEQVTELRRSRAALEELLGHPVVTMAYPYGRYDATTVDAAREAGYEIACANGGAGPWHPLELPREGMFPRTSATRLRLKVAGVYGPIQSLRGRLPG